LKSCVKRRGRQHSFGHKKRGTEVNKGSNNQAQKGPKRVPAQENGTGKEAWGKKGVPPKKELRGAGGESGDQCP